MKQPTLTPPEYRKILTHLLEDRYRDQLARLIRDVLLEEFSYEPEEEDWTFEHDYWKINFSSEQLDHIQLDDLTGFIERVRGYMHKFVAQQVERRMQALTRPALCQKQL